MTPSVCKAACNAEGGCLPMIGRRFTLRALAIGNVVQRQQADYAEGTKTTALDSTRSSVMNIENAHTSKNKRVGVTFIS